MIACYAPQYVRFANDGMAYGAYGHRLVTNVAPYDLLQTALAVLKKTPDSRQCVVSLWRPDDLITAYEGTKNDLPCTLSWQFFIRNNALHLSGHMRSNDVWLGFPYDVYVNTCIQRMMAGTLKLAVGDYVHSVGSMHLYDKNRGAAQEAVAAAGTYVEVAAPSQPHEHLDEAPLWCAIEQAMRDGTYVRLMPNAWDAMSGLGKDTLACVATRWSKIRFWPPSFRKDITHAYHRRQRSSRQDDTM